MRELKYFLAIGICFLITGLMTGQKILFVDDNDFILNNSDTLVSDIKATGYKAEVYNIEKKGGIAPSEKMLLEYDIVIWYSSTDGVLLNFWDSNTLSSIKKYIDSGKLFWVVGLDLLFAKYGVPPIQFNETEFPYDYLGVEKYKVQSYGNDGQKGCPEMIKSAVALSSYAPIVKWTFPTLWWADACDITQSSIPIYTMGPSSYELAGGISMYYYQMDKRRVLCTYFDPALIDTYKNRVLFLKTTFDFLNILTNSKEILSKFTVKISPNPAVNSVNVISDEGISKIKIISINGQTLKTFDVFNLNESKIDVSELNEGLYLLESTNQKGKLTYHKLIKTK